MKIIFKETIFFISKMGSVSSSNNEIIYQPQNEKKLECTICKNEGMNEYIYKLDVNIPNLDPPEFIIIVDKSGSMGHDFNTIISKTIPEVLYSLRYENRKIHLITFANDVEYSSISKSELKNSKSRSYGKTYMAKSYDILEKIFSNLKKKCNNLRILIITDGKLDDQEDTKKRGELLYEKYKNDFKINSQCIRLCSQSEESADAEGIVSFLKFNNVKRCDLVNHKSRQLSSLSRVIIKLFIDDGLNNNNLKLIGEDDVKLKNFPWVETSSNTLPFRNGKYIIFGDKIKPLFIGSEKTIIPLDCEKGEEINTNNYENIASQKINNTFQRFSINKLLNSELCEKENILIKSYFNGLCKKIKRDSANDKTLDYLKEKIKNIDNIKNINNLNEDIKAYYVKEIDEKNIDYKKYGKNYNEKDFNSKVDSNKNKIGVKPLYYAFLLYYALPRVSLADKAIIIGCLGYLISPFDLIPDFIPVVGYADDAAALTWAAYRIGARVDDEVKERARKKVMGIFDLTEEQINRTLND